MIEPLNDNLPLKLDASDKDLAREQERHESLVEPIAITALKQDVSGKDLPR
jgi:hypothetical protein